ncbi:XRE family transcriptional regulator [Macrococcoides caseolyticum subsp. caseolyticum]|uniref:helix-turn-helix domain-containing protein n=1 Tax=Macrococcoides caseolyticum TaxID=69966 RepID=UPI000CCFE64B|nr:helix-turn-helix transcriptional regulator [Macrococcus caseolyticus]PNZ69975.1 XRE family transcriptional regulator [Macrococcus caseolyticus]QPT47125.1 helix-turn-helix transcriptional regulator [Macrococcus caseolyticus]RAK48329.1 XRE family transcriptional regulator [Macrococcus caseolyticus subsp. caseolyticus]HCD18166.1 XRE family transcriptional regulator [Macrococcus caseolyticus]
MKNNLSLILGAKRITISKVSKETGISRTTLTGIYHEKTNNPDSATVLKICSYLGITPNQFYGYEKI